MIVYTLLGLALVLTALMVPVGGVLFVRGIKARRLDDHPLCRRCGYDLFNLTPDKCPECGVSVKLRDRIIIGHRTRHKPMMAWGLALVLSGAAGCWLAERQRGFIRATPGRLHHAIKHGDYATADAILKRYPELIDNNFLGEPSYMRPPLHVAAEYAHQGGVHRRLFERILRDNPDLDLYRTDGGGQPDMRLGTALHVAIHYGDVQTVEALLKAGADPNLPGDDGRTPLCELAFHQSLSAQAPAIASLLLRYGADPALLDDWGMTPLHHLAEHDRDTLLLALLRAGVDPNLPDAEGFPPIQNAIRLSPHTRSVGHLLRYGADPTLANHRGELPGTFNPRSSNKNDNTQFWWMLLTDELGLANDPGVLPFLKTPEGILQRAPGILAFKVRTLQYKDNPLFTLAVFRRRLDLLALFLEHADLSNPDTGVNLWHAHAHSQTREEYAESWAMLEAFIEAQQLRSVDED